MDAGASRDANPLLKKIANFLYHHCFSLYSLLYPAFKKRQDAVEIEWIRRLVRPGTNILDIGANVGFYTFLLSDLVGSRGTVHAFEPEATNFGHLSRKGSRRSNVILVPKAVSDRSGKLLIYTSPNMNVEHRTYRVENYQEALAVDGVSIDDYVRGRFKVDFIKMDVQGYEHHALRGMERTILSNPAVVILSEFWPYGFKQCGGTSALVYNYIRSLDLQMWLPERDRLHLVTRKTVERFRESEPIYYTVILSKEPIK